MKKKGSVKSQGGPEPYPANAGMGSDWKIRNPKPEIRRKGRKPEIRAGRASVISNRDPPFLGFGIGISFGFLVSDFGFCKSPLLFTAYPPPVSFHSSTSTLSEINMTPAAVLKIVQAKAVQFIDLRFMDFPGLW